MTIETTGTAETAETAKTAKTTEKDDTRLRCCLSRLSRLSRLASELLFRLTRISDKALKLRLERIADAEVKGHIAPLEVVNPPLALGHTWIVELDT